MSADAGIARSHALQIAARRNRAKLLAKLFVELRREAAAVARNWRRIALAAGPRGRLT